MKITAIKQQVKRPDRYSIYADDAYVFSLGETGLLKAGLFVGLDIDADQLEAYKISSKYDKLYDLSLRYIAIRLRSEWEMQTYLKRKEASPEDAAAIMERLRDNRWLDETAFARAWVSNRRQLKPTSKRRLQQELRAKRVDEHIVSAVLEEDETDESDVLIELIRRRRRQTRYQDDVKLMQYLIRQGFSYSDVKDALRSEAENL
ncbi:MAG: hypothetical protein JWM37_418 [Candidatus Saccharibacteria bacterium]|nr:hypothetical protein [Candidatus Saccharibacteria bacterium]